MIDKNNLNKDDEKYIKDKENMYELSCVSFLTYIENGIEPTPYDKKIISELYEQYNLNHQVINVLLEYCLKACDNKLIKNYIYAIASSFSKNKIETYEEAISYLKKQNEDIKNKKEGNNVITDLMANSLYNLGFKEQCKFKLCPMATTMCSEDERKRTCSSCIKEYFVEIAKKGNIYE